MPPKRPSTGPESSTPSKAPKGDHLSPDDFSNSVRKKLASSTRTGQACDRCKIRKIRCDGLPGGCSPCIQNNVECKTTDRITGRATSRGYVEGLEQRCRAMEGRVRELENRLISMGVDIKPTSFETNPAPVLDWSSQSGPNVPAQMWSAEGRVSNGAMMQYATPGSSTPQQETNIFRALPVFRTGCNGENYLGVSSGNSYLSSIRGTALSVLGMEIDLADFTSADMDEPSPTAFQPDLYNKSYQGFLQSVFNVNLKVDKVELPPKNEGLTYAQWYLRVLNPYLPILHKPSFMTLLTRMYDDPDFRPTAAETVMVHMMFAILFFQYAARNWENASQQSDLNTRSNLHYHYALGFFYQLLASHTLQDVQAMALICSHIRNLPKPGASWMAINMTMAVAIELGLHRSAKRWVQPTPQTNILEIEMRKRTFWSVLAIHISISGKLGRPMALRLEDIDVELPEPIDDDLLSESGIDTSRTGKCNFLIGIEAFKLEPAFMELYSNVYVVKRSPQTYIETIHRLDNKVQKWRDSWPTELISESATSDQEGRVFALYLQMFMFEYRLLLRHPSLSLTTSTDFNNENLNICLECSRGMLKCLKQLQKYKSLDTTWYNGAVYLLGMTTTLFAHWEKRDEMTEADITKLRGEMNSWLDIMGDVGDLLGSGKRLRESVRVVVDSTFNMLSKHLASKQAAAGVEALENHSAERSTAQAALQQANNYANGRGYNIFSSPGSANGGSSNTTGGNFVPAEDSNLAGHGQVYPAPSQYSYPEPSANPSMSYPPQSSAFDASGYTSTDANLGIGVPTTDSNSTNAFMFSSTTPTPYGTSQSWRQWTGAMTGNMEMQDAYSASALMQLGGRDLAQGDASQGAPVADMTGNVGGQGSGLGQDQGQQPWPLMIFDIGPGSS